MSTYKKLYTLHFAAHIGNVAVPFIPLLCVLAAFGLNSPIASERVGIWIGLGIAAFISVFIIEMLMHRIHVKAEKKLHEYCGEVIKPLFPPEFSDLQIEADKGVLQQELSPLFRKKKPDLEGWKYTDYDGFYGSWKITGKYKNRDFLFSKLTLLHRGARGIGIKGYRGCFIKINISIDAADAEAILEKIVPCKNLKYHHSEDSGCVYIGLDGCAIMFDPKADIEEYKKISQANIALITEVLDAFI